MKHVAVVGAGLVGRLLALELQRQGCQVSLYDKDDRQGVQSCAYVAAGMLCPYAEVETADSIVAELGLFSIQLWPKILASLPSAVTFQQQGSLLLAHIKDQPELQHFISRLLAKVAKENIQSVSREALFQLEPDLSWPVGGYFFPQEGFVANDELLPALADALISSGVQWFEKTDVIQIMPGQLRTQEKIKQVDWVFDCRGLGAKQELQNLRGVRGELFLLHAPEVNLTRPIRLLHPRYRVYVVPRAQSHYVVGASEIESEDQSPVSVRSTLELLSLAYSLHPGFSEARVVRSFTQCRPAFSDNLPKILHQPGLTAINGLYRHGYLLAPILVQEVVNYILNSGKMNYHALWEEIGD